jgi:hypothetical protein
MEPIEKFPRQDPPPQPQYDFLLATPHEGGDDPGAEEGAGGGQQAAEDFQAVLRIHDILLWIRIRIRGSMPLTNGSGSGLFSFHH